MSRKLHSSHRRFVKTIDIPYPNFAGIFTAVFVLDCLAYALLSLKVPPAVKTVLELVDKLAVVIKVGCLLGVRIFLLPLCLGRCKLFCASVFMNDKPVYIYYHGAGAHLKISPTPLLPHRHGGAGGVVAHAAALHGRPMGTLHRSALLG